MLSCKRFQQRRREAFCEGHNEAFRYFGGVPRQHRLRQHEAWRWRGSWGTVQRQRTKVFSELQSHYLFEDRFGRPGKGNDKGKVEGLVGYARRNFMVPIPRFESWEALNEQLEAATSTNANLLPEMKQPAWPNACNPTQPGQR